MNYEILVNNNVFLEGNLITLGIIALCAFIVFIFLLEIIWRKLRSIETLKYEFVTIIAHKFRTPLTKIKWIMESVLESEHDPFKKENFVNLNTSNETLINLTNTLIELTDKGGATMTSYNFQRINVTDFVKKNADSMTQRFHEQNLFVSYNFPNPEVFSMIDVPRMEFVLQTIMENAINYNYTGKNVEIAVKKEGHKVSISVIDEGIGIDPADKTRLLTKFFRSQAARRMDTEGFGVALYLANSIVAKHKGKLKVASAGLDKGTTVTVVLDVAK